MSIRSLLFLLFSAFAVTPALAGGGQVVLQPSDSASNDVLVTQDADFNFNTAASGFGNYLAVGADAGAHGNTKSLISFDLSGYTSSITSADVQSATLQLFAISSSTSIGFGVDPDAGHPITYSVQGLASSWSANTVTWSTVPSGTSSLALSGGTQNGINDWVSFDVTAAVKGWLDGSVANNGLLISGAAPVLNDGHEVIGTFYSALGADTIAPGFEPRLIINPVPEPGTLALAGGLASAFALSYWRKKRPVSAAEAAICQFRSREPAI